jgi:hypothetical protein
VAVALVLVCCGGVCSAQQASPQTSSGDGWQLDLSPYLWFAGTHGTAGALGHDVSIRASAGDLLSHFNMGLMGAAEARHKRFVLNGNLQWIRLSDEKVVPIQDRGTISADARIGQLVWASKLGYRLIDHENLKADASVGVRFWNLGQKFNFNFPARGFSLNPSQNWADVVIGGRVQLPVAQKTKVDLVGDVGGWNASAKLDYAFAALLDHEISSKWSLLAGYGYQFIDYRGNNAFIFNMVTSGVVAGVTYHLK